MIRGAVKSFKHEHHFEEANAETLMKDVFDYQSPFGILGRLADKLFLEKYMTALLEKRNVAVKGFAESEDWKKVLEE